MAKQFRVAVGSEIRVVDETQLEAACAGVTGSGAWSPPPAGALGVKPLYAKGAAMDETIREFEDWMDVRGLKCKAHHYRGKWHVVLYGQNTDRTTRACFVSHQHFSLACTAARLAFEAGNPVCATG